MAQPWARLATLLGRVHGQPCQGGSLPWRNIDFFCRWSQGLGVWSGGSGGLDGQKILRLPTGGVCVGMPRHKDGIALPHLYVMQRPLEIWGKFSLNGCHIMENSRRDVLFSHLGSQTCQVPGSLGENLIGVYAFFSWGPLSLLLGLMAQASLEEFQLSTPSLHDVVDMCRLHGPGSLRWFTPSPIEIGLGCDAKFFSLLSATPPPTSRMARYKLVRLQHLPWTL